MFVRYVAQVGAENPWFADGVIVSADSLRIVKDLDAYQLYLVQSAFDWLNENLPCPPIEQNVASGEWSQDAVSWFLSDAKEPISWIKRLIAVLKWHRIKVLALSTPDPGKIVYRDDFQVVAETPWDRLDRANKVMLHCASA